MRNAWRKARRSSIIEKHAIEEILVPAIGGKLVHRGAIQLQLRDQSIDIGMSSFHPSPSP